ncbi:MAG: hypothetical protein AAF600_15825 [Bacteroidota bacterium]
MDSLLESFAKLDFWLKSKLSEFQKRSLLVVNEAFEILSNEELGQKAGFSKDSIKYSTFNDDVGVLFYYVFQPYANSICKMKPWNYNRNNFGLQRM